MNKDTIKEILHIIIAVVVSIIAVKFVIWLFPIILIAILSYHIYKTMKKDKRTNAKTTKKPAKKEIKIIDMEEND